MKELCSNESGEKSKDTTKINWLTEKNMKEQYLLNLEIPVFYIPTFSMFVSLWSKKLKTELKKSIIIH